MRGVWRRDGRFTFVNSWPHVKGVRGVCGGEMERLPLSISWPQ